MERKIKRNEFSDRLSQLIWEKMSREKKTKTEIASELGLNSRQLLEAYTNGKAQPQIDTIIKMANYFNVSCDYLLGNIVNDIPENEKKLIASQITGLNQNTIEILKEEQDKMPSIDEIKLAQDFWKKYYLKEMDWLSEEEAEEKAYNHIRNSVLTGDNELASGLNKIFSYERGENLLWAINNYISPDTSSKLMTKTYYFSFSEDGYGDIKSTLTETEIEAMRLFNIQEELLRLKDFIIKSESNNKKVLIKDSNSSTASKKTANKPAPKKLAQERSKTKTAVKKPTAKTKTAVRKSTAKRSGKEEK